MSKRGHHAEEFKAEAVDLVENSDKGVAAIAHDLGISPRTLYHWLEERQASRREGIGGGSDLQAEVKRLQRELEITRQERDILKKAIKVFSKE